VGLVVGAGGEVQAWSTPWYSNAAASVEGWGPLAAILLLRHGRGAVLAPVEGAAVGQTLMRTLALPFWSAALMGKALGMLDAIVTATRWWEFHFAPTTTEAAALIPRLIASLDGR
jgi:hypothetical protein